MIIANHLNIKTISKTFGEIELKYVSVGDLTFFVRLLDRIKGDKEFAIRALYHQITTPKVSFTEFRKIPDEELIELARDFVGYEQHIFQYFKETTDEEFFTNFRKAIKAYYQKQVQVKQLQTTLKPVIESSRKVKKVLENFSKQYTDIIKPAIKITSYITNITNMIKEVSRVDEQLRRFIITKSHIVESLKLVESLKPVIEQHQQIARVVSKRLVPQINLWQKWVDQNRAIFDSYTRFWQTFQKQYKITEQEAIQILRKYKWFITSSLPLSFVFAVVKIGRRKGNQHKVLNRLFVSYFLSDNFENLENLVDGWRTNEIFRPRIKVFRDCVFTMRNAKGKYNPSNLVLPTLIAQIDGIQREFMEQNGLSFDLKKRKWEDKKGNVVGWKAWFKSQTSNQKLLDLANDLFLNILFQKSQPGKPLKTPFTFNRHKIMHGEYFRYGRIDNAIRAFLILDFLATLSK